MCTCSFCIIPKIRGTQRSRTIDDVVAEARKLGRSGVKELILVAQDMTSYGIDLDPQANHNYLERLLRRLDTEADGVEWIRLLYMYTDELLEIFKTADRVLPYIDMPLQHICAKLLKSMRRNIRREKQRDLIDRIRAVDDMVLRTTFRVRRRHPNTRRPRRGADQPGDRVRPRRHRRTTRGRRPDERPATKLTAVI